MANNKEKPFPPEMVQMLNTEHFTLQSARGQLISESNGRLSSFLTMLSAGVVSLAFISQTLGVGETFFIFAFILFPSIIFLGFATMMRITQLAINDGVYVRGMNRIRHFFTEVAPEMEKYLILSIYDDRAGLIETMNIKESPNQIFLSSTTIVAVFTSILAGVFFGLIGGSLFNLDQTQTILTAVIGFFTTVLLFFNLLNKLRKGFKNTKAEFPTPIE